MSGPPLPSDLEGPEDELFAAILRLRHAFLDQGMKPPAVIELASWEDGMKLLRLARARYRDRYRRALYGRSAADSPITEIQISGVTVRWPPQRWSAPAATRSGLSGPKR